MTTATTPLTVGTNNNRGRSAAFAGETLQYAFAETSLGIVLAVCSERGVCSVALGQDRDEVLAEVQARFSAAKLMEEQWGGSGAAEAVAEAVARMIESPGSDFEFAVDIRGTDFQWRVWEALREIPRGTTLSYGEIARRIGAPKAVRAVGAACGANRLAVIIPCHRAVASTGRLTGYRWGLEWKRALLERESGL